MKQSRGELSEYYTDKVSIEIRSKIILHYTNIRPIISFDIWRQHCQRELNPQITYESPFREYLSKCSDEEFLSALQILLMIHLEQTRSSYEYVDSFKLAIEIINKIFKIEKVGFDISYVSDSHQTDVPILIIPIDSECLHDEVIQPTRTLLHKLEFGGVLNEFDNALDDLRFEKYEDCIHKAGKAYESTLKTILDKKQLPHTKGEKISALLSKVRDALKLKDPSLNTLFEHVWPVLNQGPNIIRNFEGIGHGQGADIKKYEESYANFVLHLAGTYIVFLLERDEKCT
ncbi:MAG: abortive infection family protein [Methanoregula sp.]